jgi:hypothetical protein
VHHPVFLNVTDTVSIEWELVGATGTREPSSNILRKHLGLQNINTGRMIFLLVNHSSCILSWWKTMLLPDHADFMGPHLLR